jgi:hypothetical protein
VRVAEHHAYGHVSAGRTCQDSGSTNENKIEKQQKSALLSYLCGIGFPEKVSWCEAAEKVKLSNNL